MLNDKSTLTANENNMCSIWMVKFSKYAVMFDAESCACHRNWCSYDSSEIMCLEHIRSPIIYYKFVGRIVFLVKSILDFVWCKLVKNHKYYETMFAIEMQTKFLQQYKCVRVCNQILSASCGSSGSNRCVLLQCNERKADAEWKINATKENSWKKIHKIYCCVNAFKWLLNQFFFSEECYCQRILMIGNLLYWSLNEFEPVCLFHGKSLIFLWILNLICVEMCHLGANWMKIIHVHLLCTAI